MTSLKLCKRFHGLITLVRSSDEHVYLERFGPRRLTVFNDSPERRAATITLDGYRRCSPGKLVSRELLGGRSISWQDHKTTLTLDGEDVAVLELE